MVIAAKKASVATAYQKRYATNAAASESRATSEPIGRAKPNARVVQVLTATTGKDLGDSPGPGGIGEALMNMRLTITPASISTTTRVLTNTTTTVLLTASL